MNSRFHRLFRVNPVCIDWHDRDDQSFVSIRIITMARKHTQHEIASSLQQRCAASADESTMDGWTVPRRGGGRCGQRGTNLRRRKGRTVPLRLTPFFDANFRLIRCPKFKRATESRRSDQVPLSDSYLFSNRRQIELMGRHDMLQESVQQHL